MSSPRDIAAVMALTGNSGVPVAESFGKSHGVDLWDNLQLTENWLRAEADAGNAEAQHALAVCLGLSLIQPRHEHEARQLASASAARDFPPAHVLMFSFMFDDLERGLISHEQALAPLERAVSLGYPRAMYMLSFWLSHGDRIPRDTPRASILLQQAADAGDPESMVRLGVALLDSENSEHIQAGLRYLRSAADKGSEGALSKLTDCYKYGCEGLDADTELAKEFEARLESVIAIYKRVL